MLSLYILVQLASKCRCQHLNSPANTQYRYLTVNSKMNQSELLPVTTRVNGDALQRLFAKIIGVYIGTTGQNNTVQPVQK